MPPCRNTTGLREARQGEKRLPTAGDKESGMLHGREDTKKIKAEVRTGRLGGHRLQRRERTRRAGLGRKRPEERRYAQKRERGGRGGGGR